VHADDSIKSVKITRAQAYDAAKQNVENDNDLQASGASSLTFLIPYLKKCLSAHCPSIGWQIYASSSTTLR